MFGADGPFDLMTVHDHVINSSIHNQSQTSDYDDHTSSDESVCESSTSDSSYDPLRLSLFDGLTRLDEQDNIHNTLRRIFISGLGSLGCHTTVLAIHRKMYSRFTCQARLQSFKILSRALEKKCGGNANSKLAWCGTSKDEISKIISFGFGMCGKPQNNEIYGQGTYLSPIESSIESVKLCSSDQEGIRHVFLCRILLGKSELIQVGSGQCHPSSEEFDSGVDNLEYPKKYIVWSTHMNTHIMPDFVISFRAPDSLEGFFRIQNHVRRPISPWITFPSLISELKKKLLTHAQIQLIDKYHNYFLEKKISRSEMVQRVRRIAGDELLITIIKSLGSKPKARSRLQNNIRD